VVTSPADAFFARWHGAASAEERARFDESLRALVDRAALELPGIALSVDAFASYLADRIGPERAPSDAVTGAGLDLALASACLQGVPAALALFDARFRGVLDQIHARLVAADLSADEFRQRMREHLFVESALACYRGDGSLAAWLRVVAARRAIDWRAASRRHREIPTTREELLGAVDGRGDPALALLRGRHRDAFRAALSSAIAELSSRDRAILRYRYVLGLDVADIADIYGVHRVTLSRRLASAAEQVLASTRRALAETIGVEETEVDSVIRALRSDPELVFSELLDTPVPAAD
jgi:RNA polymerase sigma-70 factor (ECF subfamily)